MRDLEELKLARGILFEKNRVLLAEDVKNGHFFLPGGHVETKEPVKSALEREWKEELGWDIETGQFYGCIEHAWEDPSRDMAFFEINYLFAVRVKKGDKAAPQSREKHIRFAWIDIAHLGKTKLYPAPLKKMLPVIYELADSAGAVWESTL